ncbi:hypothetical protein RHGRI_022717 [Rhododendron griersonianum]|uniref:CID domain-containing protein n=1 Tax=Rhododendron griersonianum TaxID=479676 RepID=A0AAV6J5G2_9ERIC|nr:hypothetical protein RHGRI_022717 [Rhododendron griersonianum]
MGGTFNPQILVEKLAKLNSSQQSIETLSHWCIFHMYKAKQVVETWDRQFHCSPREQRLAFLYLANDILQNSRRKGLEFVSEFWKVLPGALRDVIENGDESGKSAARRLVSIWEERKVFGSRGQILKEELVGRHLDNSNTNGKHSAFKLRPSAGNALDKIVSGYQVVYAGQLDEDNILCRCRNAISCIEKVDKEIGGVVSGKLNGSGVVEELQGQHAILRDCTEQLMAVESSRANLVSHLREALQEQEFKLDQIRDQLQAAQSQSEQASNLCRQLLADQSMKETHTTNVPQGFTAGNGEQSVPVMYTRQLPFPEKSGEDPKAAAAAVAAKLTASTSSAQMLTYVLSSLASEGVIGNKMKESSSDYPSEKRTKLENDHHPAYIPSHNPQPLPVQPYPHPESVPITTQESNSNELQPPPPSSPPPLPPLPPPMQPYPVPQFMQSTSGLISVPYGYGTTQMQQTVPIPGYSPVGPPMHVDSSFIASPPNPYQSFQGSDGGFYSQPTSLPMAPMSRQ